MRTLLAAVVLTVASLALTATIPAGLQHVTTHWGDFTTLGFGLALLVAWPIGTFIFTPRRKRT